MTQYDVINSRAPRLDAPAKATGRAKYIDDLKMPNMLYGALLQSPYAHAKILNIDTSKAEKLPGVKRVITAKDIGTVNYGMSPARYDETVFCTDKVRYVGDEIAYGPRLAGLEGETLRQRVRWAMALVGLDFDATKDRPTFALSGGEKRKVALASSLALQPTALLLDEPTAGLDPVSRRDLLQRLAGLATEMTLVISSHQMEDLAYLVEELSVLYNGRMLMTGSTGSVFSTSQALRDIGLDVPIATEVALKLRAMGWSLPEGIVKVEQLTAALGDDYE